MPLKKRRHSEVSNLDLDPVCTMDPTFRKGRCTQLLGLVGMPLIPGIALIIYCAVQLADITGDFILTKGVEKSLRETTETWDMVMLLLEEMDGAVSLIAGNGTIILGQMEEFYRPTDASLEIIGSWLANVDLDIVHDLGNHRRLHNELQNTSIFNEVSFYSTIVTDVGDVIFGLLDQDLRVTFWPSLVSYYSLLQTLLDLGIERSLGMVSFVQGYLTVPELEQYSGAMELGHDHINTALVYSPVVEEQYNLLFTSNDYLTDWLESSRDQILRNDVSEGDLFQSLVWYRKISTVVNVIRNIEREVRTAALHKIQNSLQFSIRVISFYVIIIFVVMFMISPFLFAAAYKTVSSLVHYSNASERRNFELKREKRKTELLLNEMLPRAVAYRLRKGEEVEAETYEQVTIFFSDITDFNDISTESDPIDIVIFLNEIYLLIDTHVEKYDVYKVETISASYMVASGLPSRNGDRHSAEIARFSLDLMTLTQEFVIPHLPDRPLQLRIGCHTGPAVAGVVGNKMPRYCLFGDTVNTASRMQSNGLPRKIHISQSTYKGLSEYGGYVMEHRGTIQVKGKGAMNTYWLLGKKDAKKDRLRAMSVYERAVMKMEDVTEAAEEV